MRFAHPEDPSSRFEGTCACGGSPVRATSSTSAAIVQNLKTLGKAYLAAAPSRTDGLSCMRGCGVHSCINRGTPYPKPTDAITKE